MAEHDDRAEREDARGDAADERGGGELDRTERVGRPADEQERRDDADAPERDVERGRDELARGRRATDGRHPEERRDEHVCDELDLAGHDPDVERARDLRGERGAPADEDRERHGDGRERDEVDGDGMTRDERPTGRGDDDERQPDDDELAIVAPRFLRVALDEERYAQEAW